MSKIIERIIKKICDEEIVEKLTEKIEMNELHSLLLEVFNIKANQTTYSKILNDYSSNKLFYPSSVSVKKLSKLEYSITENLEEDIEMIEISPIAPLGTCSKIGILNQNRVISTIRNSEVVSDATNVLALEIAARKKMKRGSSENISIGAHHRVTRGQKFDEPNFTQHFKIFSLVTGGRDKGGNLFEIESLHKHLTNYIRIYTLLLEENNKIYIKFWTQKSLKGEKIVSELLNRELLKNGKLEIEVDNQEISGGEYYENIRFMMGYKVGENIIYNIDGGFTDWTQKLLSDKKERLLTSCIGTEIMLKTLNLF